MTDKGEKSLRKKIKELKEKILYFASMQNYSFGIFYQLILIQYVHSLLPQQQS